MPNNSVRTSILSFVSTALLASSITACSASDGAAGSSEENVDTQKSPVSSIGPIRNDYGRWLDAELSSANRNGTKIQLWDWNGGNNQRWGFTWWGNDLWSIQSTYGSWRCLDAALESIGGNGTKVQLWDCNFDTQQLWRLESGGQIVNARSGRCLDADLNNINNLGTKVQLWDCTGGQHQRWTIQ